MTEQETKHGTFIIERTLPFPPARVFGAFANPEAKARWFAPPPEVAKVTAREQDFRVGGREKAVSTFNDGKVTTYLAQYYDIVPNERIVYAYEMLLDDKRMSISLATVQVAAAGNGTKLVITEQGVFLDGRWSNEEREQGTRWLVDCVERSLGGPGDATGSTRPMMAVSRVLDAPAMQVFDAWAKPENLAKWWGPKEFTTPVCELDFRVGGKLRMVMRGFGQDHGFGGVYREIVPGKKIVFTTVIDGSPDHEMLTSVTFESLGERKTKITVEQTAPALEVHARGQKQGWGESLEKLAGHVAKG
jgi:uncharacterized protein YndB with AHSA1/START domain